MMAAPELNPVISGFENTEIGFSLLSDADLWRSYYLFRAIGHPLLVKYGSKLLLAALNMRLPVNGLVRATMYKHFCGGETQWQLIDLASKLRDQNVLTVCDYAVELAKNESDAANAYDELVSNFRFAQASAGSVPFVVFKATAMIDYRLLAKVSRSEPMNAKEVKEWEIAQARIHALFEQSVQTGIPILVDAEESWLNPAIDGFLEVAAKRYNKPNRPLIYQTIQMYLCDRLDYLRQRLAAAQSGNYSLGFKIVRGAYHEKESKVAAENGIVAPVFSQKSETDDAFDKAVSLCLESECANLFLGTHNLHSVTQAADTMDHFCWDRADRRVYFSQLYGMSDPLSFNLAHHGYNVCKYVPYGPVTRAIPYLMRRAEENAFVAGQSGREVTHIQEELRRRRRART